MESRDRVVPGVVVRLATPEDADAISHVIREAFEEYQERYSAEAFASTTPPSTAIVARMREGPLWVALVDGVTAGTISAVETGQGCYIRMMAVSPAARGQRIGWKLLERIEKFALEHRLLRLYLSTTPFLDRAIALYEKYGFRRTDDGPTDLFGTPLFTMAKQLVADGS